MDSIDRQVTEARRDCLTGVSQLHAVMLALVGPPSKEIMFPLARWIDLQERTGRSDHTLR